MAWGEASQAAASRRGSREASSSPAAFPAKDPAPTGSKMDRSFRPTGPEGASRPAPRGRPSPRRDFAHKYRAEAPHPAVTPAMAPAAPSAASARGRPSGPGAPPSTVPRDAHSHRPQAMAAQAPRRPAPSRTTASRIWDRAVGAMFRRPSQ